MESDLQKKRKSAEDSALFDNVASEKLKFPLYNFFRHDGKGEYAV